MPSTPPPNDRSLADSACDPGCASAQARIFASWARLGSAPWRYLWLWVGEYGSAAEYIRSESFGEIDAAPARAAHRRVGAGRLILLSLSCWHTRVAGPAQARCPRRPGQHHVVLL